MNKEIEELKAQKRAIEEKIRQLQNKEYTFGRAKLSLQHFGTSRADDWKISILRKYTDKREDKEVWCSVIVGTDKKATIDKLDNVIRDLTGLRGILKGEQSE